MNMTTDSTEFAGTAVASSGSGKAIGIGVGAAAGVAVAIAPLVHHHHAASRSQASITGCTQSILNGISLKNESDNLTLHDCHEWNAIATWRAS
jgi:hypothetical protein